jgi:threonine aldolase
MEPVDLRSDTVTRPTPAMRRAMAEAEVGDDVYFEDPTVRRLEERAAAAVGQEAALFVPSGIMGNQIGLRLVAPRGTELLCDQRAHVLLYENGGAAALSGIQTRPLPSNDGLPSPEAFAAAIVVRDPHRLATGALALENTHNVAGGRVFSRARLEPILGLAREAGLPVHLDGARIWNAAAALGTTPAALTAGFTTVMFCFSKGLGAPVGSVICASRERIAEAVEIRRQLGGAMRQVGVLAAAALVALDETPPLLARDHERARRLAAAIAGTKGLEIDPATVESNIVVFRVRSAEKPGPAAGWVERARREGILASTLDADHVRLVTHRDVDDAGLQRAIDWIRRSAAA